MLDFGLIDTKKNEAIISGPQFEQEASKAKLVQHGFTGTSQETVYTVPTGKTFFVTKMMLMNTSTTTELWTVRVNGSRFFVKNILTKETQEIDFDSPLPLTTGTVVAATSGDANNEMILIGWEI